MSVVKLTCRKLKPTECNFNSTCDNLVKFDEHCTCELQIKSGGQKQDQVDVKTGCAKNRYMLNESLFTQQIVHL